MVRYRAENSHERLFSRASLFKYCSGFTVIRFDLTLPFSMKRLISYHDFDEKDGEERCQQGAHLEH